jgi:hypothetical protein
MGGTLRGLRIGAVVIVAGLATIMLAGTGRASVWSHLDTSVEAQATAREATGCDSAGWCSTVLPERLVLTTGRYLIRVIESSVPGNYPISCSVAPNDLLQVLIPFPHTFTPPAEGAVFVSLNQGIVKVSCRTSRAGLRRGTTVVLTSTPIHQQPPG